MAGVRRFATGPSRPRLRHRQLSAAIAPFVSRVIAVDGSPAMLQAVEETLQRVDNIELRRGELEIASD